MNKSPMSREIVRNVWVASLIPNFMLQIINQSMRSASQGLQHVIFCLVDHYEPFNGGVSNFIARSRVDSWVKNYPKMADRFVDADGRKPLHSWFYPPHLDRGFLKALVELCAGGYGEVELHLHHNHMLPFPDTAETLRKKILTCMDDYARFGIFCLPSGKRVFGFIHGDWALANSRGSEFCGVNDEIKVLKLCGCYADFTFPCLWEAQPRMMNTMFYARSDPTRSKSYDTGRILVSGGEEWGDLLLIQGILGLRLVRKNLRLKVAIEASNIDASDIADHNRIDYWINNAIRIPGQPEWLFIKLHTHGAREIVHDAMFGGAAERMYDYLCSRYNDGKKYRLHFVSAREMYNIVKAAEAGKSGDPVLYRDYFVPKYVYLS